MADENSRNVTFSVLIYDPLGVQSGIAISNVRTVFFLSGKIKIYGIMKKTEKVTESNVEPEVEAIIIDKNNNVAMIEVSSREVSFGLSYRSSFKIEFDEVFTELEMGEIQEIQLRVIFRKKE